MEALVSLLVEELVAFAQVTVFSGVRQITTGMVHEGQVTTLSGLAGDTRCRWSTGRRHGIVEQLPLPSGRDAARHRPARPRRRPRRRARRLGTEPLVPLPLAARGRTFGALAVARRRAAATTDDLGFLDDLAQRVSVALDVNLVVAESRHVASVLRQTMMPATTRSVPPRHRGVPARRPRARGARRRLLRHPRRGRRRPHRARSATSPARRRGRRHAKRIRNAVRTAAHVDRDAAWILGLVNRVLCSEADPLRGHRDRCCARLRPGPDALVVEIANAGHPPALVLRADGTVESVTAEGVALALLDDRRTPPPRWSCGPATPCSATRRGHGGARLRDCSASSARSASSASSARSGQRGRGQVAIAVTSHIDHRQRDDIALVDLRYLPDHT